LNLSIEINFLNQNKFNFVIVKENSKAENNILQRIIYFM